MSTLAITVAFASYHGDLLLAREVAVGGEHGSGSLAEERDSPHPIIFFYFCVLPVLTCCCICWCRISDNRKRRRNQATQREIVTGSLLLLDAVPKVSTDRVPRLASLVNTTWVPLLGGSTLPGHLIITRTGLLGSENIFGHGSDMVDGSFKVL